MCFLPQAPEGENQPSTEVDLFISTEKIMVLNTDLKVSAAGNTHNRSCWAAEYFILRIYYALLTSSSQRDLSLSVPLLSESFCSNVRPFLPPSLGRFDCTIYEQNGYAINNLLRQFREKFRACPKQSPPPAPPLAWLPSFSKSSNQTILHSPV